MRAIDLLIRPVHAVGALALPSRCPGCSVPVAEDHRFCAACWGTLHFVAPPWCAGCQRPFAYDRGPHALCGACLAERPRHAGVRAAVVYGPVAGRIAVRLKHGGRIALAETMARRMMRVMPPHAEVMIPVPLHRWRLWRRGFNQAALIADALTRRTGVAHDHHALQRRRATTLLRGLGRRERAKQVRGAFVVTRPGVVKGRAVVLVDDVYTTGATAAACTAALLKAGARSVTILCWARVLEGDD